MTHASSSSSDLARSATVTAAITAGLAALVLVLAGWAAYSTATYVPAPNEDTSLHGLGFVVAILLAVPAVVAALLAGLGFLLARKGRGGWALGVSIAALAALVPVALVVSAFVR